MSVSLPLACTVNDYILPLLLVSTDHLGQKPKNPTAFMSKMHKIQLNSLQMERTLCGCVFTSLLFLTVCCALVLQHQSRRCLTEIVGSRGVNNTDVCVFKAALDGDLSSTLVGQTDINHLTFSPKSLNQACTSS